MAEHAGRHREPEDVDETTHPLYLRGLHDGEVAAVAIMIALEAHEVVLAQAVVAEAARCDLMGETHTDGTQTITYRRRG